MSYSLDIFSCFRPQCQGYKEFAVSFVLRVLAPVYVFTIFVVTYILCRLLGGSPESSTGIPVIDRVRFILRLDRDIFASCYGGVFFTFYITIIANSLLLFQCFSHPSPNPEMSMRSFPEVFRGSNEWNRMLAV